MDSERKGPPIGTEDDWRVVSFAPQPDINAYELALIMQNVGGNLHRGQPLHLPKESLKKHFPPKMWGEMKLVERHFKDWSPPAPMIQ